jgi:hypothetical protein
LGINVINLSTKYEHTIKEYSCLIHKD